MAMTFKSWKHRQCGRKVRHSSFAIATKVLAKTVAKLNDPYLTIYACDLCEGFHIGHRHPSTLTPKLETVKDLAGLKQRILKTRICLLQTQLQMINHDLQPGMKPNTRASFERYVHYLELELQFLFSALRPAGKARPQAHSAPPSQLVLFET